MSRSTRRQLRDLLHQNLDVVLDGMTEEEDGREVNVLSALEARARAGCAFTVHVVAVPPKPKEDA